MTESERSDEDTFIWEAGCPLRPRGASTTRPQIVDSLTKNEQGRPRLNQLGVSSAVLIPHTAHLTIYQNSSLPGLDRQESLLRHRRFSLEVIIHECLSLPAHLRRLVHRPEEVDDLADIFIAQQVFPRQYVQGRRWTSCVI